MRSYGAIEIESIQGYGVVLHRGPMGQYVMDREKLSSAAIEAMDCVCKYVDGRNVLQLERLATASWIRAQEKAKSSYDVVRRLVSLKPHISPEEAERANADVSDWLSCKA
jgi:hypothetical protein